MTGCIQLGCCKHVGQGIVVCVCIKGPLQVLMEFFDYFPLEGEKLQLLCRVVGLSLAQAPTDIDYYITHWYDQQQHILIIVFYPWDLEVDLHEPKVLDGGTPCPL